MLDAKDSEKPTFYVSSHNSDFTNRQKNVFDSLAFVEKECTLKHEPINLNSTRLRHNIRRGTAQTRALKGRESLFKKHDVPSPKTLMTNMTPDFKKNPHKWTKYSLADVPESDMSDLTNTRTALSFLKEMDQRNSKDESEEAIFKAPIKFKRRITVPVQESTSSEEKKTYKGSTVCMPEYIVGVKKQKTNKRESNVKKPDKEIRLDHLLDED